MLIALVLDAGLPLHAELFRDSNRWRVDKSDQRLDFPDAERLEPVVENPPRCLGCIPLSPEIFLYQVGQEVVLGPLYQPAHNTYLPNIVSARFQVCTKHPKSCGFVVSQYTFKPLFGYLS